MSGERTDPPMVEDEPLGTSEPTWRDEQTPTGAPPASADEDAERTIDADPAWLARLRTGAGPDDAAVADADRTIDADADLLEHVRAAARAARDGLAAPPSPGPAPIDAEPAPGPEGVEPTLPAADPEPAPTGDTAPSGGPTDEPPAAHLDDQPDPVLAPTELAAEPGHTEPAAVGVDDDPDSVSTHADPGRTPGGDPWLPPSPDSPTSWLLLAAEPDEHAPRDGAAPAAASSSTAPLEPAAARPVLAPPRPPLPEPAAPPAPPASAPPAAPVDLPVPAAEASEPASASVAASPGGGRWQPPARLRPEVRPSAPLLADGAPKRRHLDWRWAVLGIVLAATVGFLIAIAVGGGDGPDPAPSSTTVPGAPTTVSTP